jgi:hypothetical protein
MACELCNKLDGSLSSEMPHEKLDKSFATTTYGSVVGIKIELHKCTECGVVLSRDIDDRDPYASWSITYKLDIV